jgi:oxygen-independent coproporphyrinogen III oxidase
MNAIKHLDLVRKYNVPGPRYTSYPTVPYWDREGISLLDWKESLLRSFQESNQSEGISLYIHLPFCESMCTFCGCHKHITKRHDEVEQPYVDALIREWELYVELFDEKPKLKEIHLGGGTPTFFAPEKLQFLLERIFSLSELDEEPLFSLEGHPNNTTEEHMQVLYDLGFRRISFGVQDYDLKVQKTINRIQPFEAVERVTTQARAIGYTSVGHDLVYGLPHQTLAGMMDTIEKTKQLNPDRIALYSYAHVPWIKGVGQRGFSEEDLPKDEEKRALYEASKEALLQMGYEEIGMDHFALPTDELAVSVREKNIHRNFMGYSSSKTQVMVGLGVSSISDSWYSFAQNTKSMQEYKELLAAGVLPIVKGHLLNEEDLIIRQHILNIMCHMETSWVTDDRSFPELAEVLAQLTEMVEDGLLTISEDGLQVHEEGKAFVRNICMAFDLKLKREKPTTRLFSQTI